MLDKLAEYFDFSKKRTILWGFIFAFGFSIVTGLFNFALGIANFAIFGFGQFATITTAILSTLPCLFYLGFAYAIIRFKGFIDDKKIVGLVGAAVVLDLLLSVAFSANTLFTFISVWVLLCKESQAQTNSEAPSVTDILNVLYKNTNQEEVRSMLQASPKLLEGDKTQRPIHHYTIIGNLDMVKVTTELGSKVSDRDGEGLTPIHLAAIHKQVPVLDFLLDQTQADVNINSSKSFTPIQLVAVEGLADIADHLIEKGATVDLISATMLGKVDLAKELLTKSPQRLTVIDRVLGCLPLHAAIFTEQVDLVSYFLEQGADPKANDAEGHDAWWWVEQKDNKAIKDLLANPPKIEAIIETAEAEDVKKSVNESVVDTHHEATPQQDANSQSQSATEIQEAPIKQESSSNDFNPEENNPFLTAEDGDVELVLESDSEEEVEIEMTSESENLDLITESPSPQLNTSTQEVETKKQVTSPEPKPASKESYKPF